MSEWTVTNHGHPDIKPESNKRAIFSLVKQKLDKGVPCLIMVRDIPPDEKNPFTTEQTVDMIRKYHESKGDDVVVMIIPDIESVNWGRGVGYEMNEYFPPENIGWVSATKIRASIGEGNDEWRELVDESIQEDVVKYLKGE